MLRCSRGMSSELLTLESCIYGGLALLSNRQEHWKKRRKRIECKQGKVLHVASLLQGNPSSSLISKSLI